MLLKEGICKTWTGTLANNADTDTVYLNYRRILVLNETVFVFKGNLFVLLSPRSGPFSQLTLGDNRSTSAVSVLIVFCGCLVLFLLECFVVCGGSCLLLCLPIWGGGLAALLFVGL